MKALEVLFFANKKRLKEINIYSIIYFNVNLVFRAFKIVITISQINASRLLFFFFFLVKLVFHKQNNNYKYTYFVNDTQNDSISTILR